MASAKTKPKAERLDWRTFITASDDTPADLIAAFDAYFEPFAQVPFVDGDSGKKEIAGGHPCLNCGEPLTGLLTAFLGTGGFRWGLVHGEGNCAGCGWPARAHHFITDADGEEMATLRNFVLQYHPDFVEKRGSSRPEAA